MKRKVARADAVHARSTGFVEVPGPLSPFVKAEIREIAERIAAEEGRDDPQARIIEAFPFARGIALKAKGAQLARRIAEAVAQRLGADLISNCEPGAETCILTCHLPARGKKGA